MGTIYSLLGYTSDQQPQQPQPQQPTGSQLHQKPPTHLSSADFQPKPPANATKNKNVNKNGISKSKSTNDMLKSKLKRNKDIRSLVASNKIVIGEPLKETFRHCQHIGAEDVRANGIDSIAPAKS
ncbi:hypothetical protein HK098_001991 [Nowakowskiella sp. JEL0407]|nr:hypothetical protein HK098_001991 [Nowakowskiella sp. JEL0407]